MYLNWSYKHLLIFFQVLCSLKSSDSPHPEVMATQSFRKWWTVLWYIHLTWLYIDVGCFSYIGDRHRWGSKPRIIYGVKKNAIICTYFVCIQNKVIKLSMAFEKYESTGIWEKRHEDSQCGYEGNRQDERVQRLFFVFLMLSLLFLVLPHLLLWMWWIIGGVWFAMLLLFLLLLGLLFAFFITAVISVTAGWLVFPVDIHVCVLKSEMVRTNDKSIACGVSKWKRWDSRVHFF